MDGAARHPYVTGRRGAPDRVAQDPADGAVRSIVEALARARCDLVASVTAIGWPEIEGAGCDVVLDDGTGTLRCRFFGRRSLPGVSIGTRLHVTGRVVAVRSTLLLLNPSYEVVAGTSATSS